MVFEDLIKSFGKPLHEFTEADIQSVVAQLGGQELERFEVAVKAATKPAKPRKVSQSTQKVLDDFDKILLGAEKKGS
jgi:hypothetical protein